MMCQRRPACSAQCCCNEYRGQSHALPLIGSRISVKTGGDRHCVGANTKRIPDVRPTGENIPRVSAREGGSGRESLNACIRTNVSALLRRPKALQSTLRLNREFLRQFSGRDLTAKCCGLP